MPNSEAIQEAGNVLGSENEAIAETAGRGAFLVQKLATRSGPVSDAVKAAAEKLNETKELAPAVDDVTKAVKEWAKSGGRVGLPPSGRRTQDAKRRDDGPVVRRRSEEAPETDTTLNKDVEQAPPPPPEQEAPPTQQEKTPAQEPEPTTEDIARQPDQTFDDWWSNLTPAGKRSAAIKAGFNETQSDAISAQTSRDMDGRTQEVFEREFPEITTETQPEPAPQKPGLVTNAEAAKLFKSNKPRFPEGYGISQGVADNSIGIRRPRGEPISWINDWNGLTEAELSREFDKMVIEARRRSDHKVDEPTPPTEPEALKETGTKEKKPSASPAENLATWVAATIGGGEITRDALFAKAAEYYGGTTAEGKFEPKAAYDALETGVNMHISKNRAFAPTGDATKAAQDISAMESLTSRLPNQSRRSQETTEMQQFSTPPAYSYLAAWAANIGPNDHVLEPSAGTGNLAIFARLAGAERVVVNELSERRADMLRIQRFDKVYTEDAEQLNNILPASEKPTTIIMNPPFSRAGERMGNKKLIDTGANHAKQALDRLSDGGRLVSIFGRSMITGSGMFKKMVKDIGPGYTVRANIGIPGKIYTKFGTTFDTRLVVIDKVPKEEGATPVTGEMTSLEGAISALEGVRDGRTTVSKQAPVEPESKDSTELADPQQPLSNAIGGGRSRRHPTRPDQGDVVKPPVAKESDERGDGKRVDAGGPKRSDTVPSSAADRGGDGSGLRDDGLAESEQAEFTESLYAPYSPKDLKIPGVKNHPDKLMQSAAMATVSPPPVDYTPNLPNNVITTGGLSAPQLAFVVYAGAAHSEMLPAVEGEAPVRRGIMNGDGTGVGKGRQIAAVILDNYRRGRKRSIWFTKNDGELASAARRDLDAVCGKEVQTFLLPKPKDSISKNGTLVASYSKLARPDRLAQITKWLGKDFDGVIIFDEAHKMGNAIAVKGGRGMKKPSYMALAGIQLQKELPNARVVYASATGATEINNLAYAERLGLWGRGTAFNDKNDFIQKVSRGGVAAMEVIARDLKAFGSYFSRNLSYDGITYDRVDHKLTPAQRALYDDMARAWRVVLNNVNAAIESIGEQLHSTASTKDIKSRALSAFWGAQQRFFNQVLNSLQMPSVLDAMEKDVAAGHSVIVQLVNTNEAQLNRAVEGMQQDQTAEDFDLTPFEMLVNFVDKSFPTVQIEEYVDEDGNTQTRPVLDADGKPVHNAAALEKKKKMIAQLRTMKNAVPLGPLDLIGIVTLSDYKLFSACLHEAKPLTLCKEAIDNLPRFRVNPVNVTMPLKHFAFMVNGAP